MGILTTPSMVKIQTKPAYLWVCLWKDWDAGHRVSAELFFSSKEVFYSLFNGSMEQQLIKVQVPIGFSDWDYIPDNY